MNRVGAAALLVTILLQGGCASLTSMSLAKATAQARDIAATGGLAADTVTVDGFRLSVFHRGLNGARAVNVYIEGDGHAWSTPHRASLDPTPRDPVALRLAVRDRSAAVLYLARPCQFGEVIAAEGCEKKYWTSHRYAGELVSVADRAIDAVLQAAGLDAAKVPLGLVGYSGGGTMATLIGARRAQTRWLVTVAGNLDHKTWSQLHDMTALSGSLNAADVAASLRDTPQCHFIGGKDRTVPRSVLDSYMARAGNHANATLVEVAEFDHQCCWEERWPEIACDALTRWSLEFTPCR